MDKVSPGLWISNISDAREQSVDVDAVITVCQEEISDNISDDTEYCYFNMSDAGTGYGGVCNYEIFSEAADQLRNYLVNQDSVLIHCHMGQSRSVSVAIAALAVLDGTDYETIHSHIANIRPQINPKNAMVELAKEYIEKNR